MTLRGFFDPFSPSYDPVWLLTNEWSVAMNYHYQTIRSSKKEVDVLGNILALALAVALDVALALVKNLA